MAYSKIDATKESFSDSVSGLQHDMAALYRSWKSYRDWETSATARKALTYVSGDRRRLIDYTGTERSATAMKNYYAGLLDEGVTLGYVDPRI